MEKSLPKLILSISVVLLSLVYLSRIDSLDKYQTKEMAYEALSKELISR